METPDQRLSHSRHRQHTEANLLQLVQHQARWVVHMVFRTKISTNRVILPSTDVGFLSFSKLCLESTWLLSVLLLIHFLPHFGLFPRRIWIRLPMTTLPCSVFHHLEWFTLNLWSRSFPQPHFFFVPDNWLDISSAINMCTLTAKKKETPLLTVRTEKYGPVRANLHQSSSALYIYGGQH